MIKKKIIKIYLGLLKVHVMIKIKKIIVFRTHLKIYYIIIIIIKMKMIGRQLNNFVQNNSDLKRKI